MSFLDLCMKRYSVRHYEDRAVEREKIDASIVCGQMMMAATDLGLGTCWVCAFDPEVAKREFGLPEGVEPINILVAGYGQPRELDQERREARRIPLDQFTDVNA